QRHDARGDGFHDALRLFAVVVSIVHAGDAALDVVLDSVHGVPAEAQCGDGRAVRAPEVVGGYLVRDAELLADVTHRFGQVAHRLEDEARRLSITDVVDDLARSFRQPHAVRLLVFCPRPAEFWHRVAGHLPPAVLDVLMPHAHNLS